MSLFNKNDDQKVTWDSINDLITLDENDMKAVLREIDDTGGFKWTMKHLTLRSGLFKKPMKILSMFLFAMFFSEFIHSTSNTGTGFSFLSDILHTGSLLLLIVVVFMALSNAFDCMTFEDLGKQSIQAKSIEWLFGIYKKPYKAGAFHNLNTIIDSYKEDFLYEQDQNTVDECKRLAGMTESNQDEDIIAKFIRAITPLRILTKESEMVDQYSYDMVMTQYGVRSRLTALIGELNHRLEQQEKDRNLKYEESLNSAISRNDKILKRMGTVLKNKEHNDALLEKSSEFKRIRDVAARTKTAAIQMNETVSNIDNDTGRSKINHQGKAV